VGLRLVALRLGPLRLAALLLFGAVAAPLYAQDHAGQYEQADIEYGARLYAGRCITCHGERGDSISGVNLRSGVFRNAATDRDLANILRDGIPGTAMTPTGYSEVERTALVAYLRNMSRIELAGIPEGDAERGRALFEGKGHCTACHRVDGRGPRNAPDLSAIATTRTASSLQRTLVDPDAAMQPINRPVHIVTRKGKVIDGRRLNEDTWTVQLIDEHENLVSLDKADLREYAIAETSPMPSYKESLSADERADLLAYLLSLKGTLR
jgi:putative heme-binding domain-containing protein